MNIQCDIVINGGYMKKKILILSAFALIIGVIILYKNYSKNDEAKVVNNRKHLLFGIL